MSLSELRKSKDNVFCNVVLLEKKINTDITSKEILIKIYLQNMF